jgi:hypothetical protein
MDNDRREFDPSCCTLREFTESLCRWLETLSPESKMQMRAELYRQFHIDADPARTSDN